MNKYIEHFITITKHIHYVRKFCFKCGFYKRGMLHDLSKYGTTEFLSSARYWNGEQSPIELEKQDKEYSIAWQHHKGHNPHHWEYWIDNIGTYDNTPIHIPFDYTVEMICDWLAAGIVYSGQTPKMDKPYSEPLKYYNEFKDKRIFEENTQKLIEYFLNIIDKHGINEFIKKCRLLKNEHVINEWGRKSK